MKAAVVRDFNQPPRYEEFDLPEPEAGETLVSMQFAGLHPVVKSIASGRHYSSEGKLPIIAGLDGIGQFDDGSVAFCFAARRTLGTMAEQALVNRERSIPLPEGLEPMQAAAIANPGMSAWLSLKMRAALAPGETVLILGATGVAGGLAVQSARYLGAGKVIAAGRNLEQLEALGADAIIALGEPDDVIRESFVAELQKGGIDVVIDYLWGRPTELLLSALALGFRPSGTKRTRLVEVGASAGETIALPAAVLRSIDLNLSGSGFGSVPLNQVFEAIPTLFGLAAAGHLKVTVESRPLAQVETVWNETEKGKRIVFSME